MIITPRLTFKKIHTTEGALLIKLLCNPTTETPMVNGKYGEYWNVNEIPL